MIKADKQEYIFKITTIKWKNIKAIIRLAILNDRLSEKQRNYLINTFCREEQ